MLFADVAALTGDEALAREMAEEVLPIAEVFQFDKIAKEARDHLAGDPFYRQMQRKFLTGLDVDPDFREAKFTDEEMGRYADIGTGGVRPPEGQAGGRDPWGLFLPGHRSGAGQLVPTHPVDPELGPHQGPDHVLCP